MRLLHQENHYMLNEVLVDLKTIRILAKNQLKTTKPTELLNYFNAATNHEQSMFLVNLFELDEEIQIVNKSAHSHGFLKPVLPLSEIFNLIKDGIDGRMNDYLQELLGQAEVMIKVKNKDGSDPDSRKMLDINIQVAATMIDKYSGLLETVLGKKIMNPVEEKLVRDGHKVVNRATERLQRIALCNSLNKLTQITNEYIEEHTTKGCLSRLFTPALSDAYPALLDWFEELTKEALSADELIGAIYSIRSQLHYLGNQRERNALRDSLDELIAENAYPVYSKEDQNTELVLYIKKYTARAEVLNIDWPNRFKKPEFHEEGLILDPIAHAI